MTEGESKGTDSYKDELHCSPRILYLVHFYTVLLPKGSCLSDADDITLRSARRVVLALPPSDGRRDYYRVLICWDQCAKRMLFFLPRFVLKRPHH